MVETLTEQLKAQTTEALKALLDYSRDEREFHKVKGNGKMLICYNKIIGELEDELGLRLENIFIF